MEKVQKNEKNVDILNFWNEYYKNNTSNMYNFWLDKYVEDFDKSDKILELGAGNGDVSISLFEQGFDVLATDLSDVAIENINKKSKVQTMRVDLREGLPFNDLTFDIVIADLCLHYFDSETTTKIVADIYRILKNGGKLLARVNSVKDVLHGAGQGEIIENNYYYVQGYYKRFFSEEDVLDFFAVFDKLDYNECEICENHNKNKEIFEILCQKS